MADLIADATLLASSLSSGFTSFSSWSANSLNLAKAIFASSIFPFLIMALISEAFFSVFPKSVLNLVNMESSTK